MQQRFIIDLNHLRVLRELQEQGTVTAAAAALHLTPSAVSQQLRRLARSVGAPMTARQGRRVRLTPQALLLLDRAEAIDTVLEHARSDLAAFDDAQAGTVVISAFASAIPAVVVPALARLARERPNLKIAVRELEPPECFSWLDRGDVDIAFSVDYAGGPSRTDGRYHRVELLADPLLAVLPTSHPLARRRSVRLGALAGERWVMGSPGHPCIDATIAAQAAAGFTADVCHRADDWQAAAALVAQGHTVALIPKIALESIAAGVVAVPIRPSEPVRRIFATVRKGSERNPHIAAALAALRTAVHQRHA